uniref:CYP81B140 n=1 Tax=Plumbago zeylanica TaxID=76149 RepID=A0A9E9P722_9CARY|nr:CYP81B140 [Plumbago zeylanica]
MEDLWVYLATLVAIYYVISKSSKKKKENLPPSPFPSLPIVGHLHLFKEPIHRNLAKVADRYGPLVLLHMGGRRILVVSSPSAAEECLNQKDVQLANRPELVISEIFGYKSTSMIWAPYGELWRNLRRVTAQELLSIHRLQLLAGIRCEEVKFLLRRINNEMIPGGGEWKTLNVKKFLFETVNNVMMRMIAGKRYYGEGDEDPEGRMFRHMFRLNEKMGEITTIGDFFPTLRWFSAWQEKTYKSVFKETDQFFQDLVDQHRRRMIEEGENFDSNRKGSSMIDVLLSLQKTDPELYTEETVKGLVLLLLIAGTDTSAATSEWALSVLLNNPDALKKAQKEIDQVVGHDRLVEESDLKNLVYLRCVIKETLRMYPVSPLLLHNSTKETDVIVGGYTIPRDTIVWINLWAIHNDPKVWKEPRKFKPERFYEEVALNKLGRSNNHNFSIMPFGAGRRSCPGESLAHRMVGMILSTLLQNFEWARLGEEEVEMAECVGFTMPKDNPLIAKCRRRKQNTVNLAM